MPALLLVVAGLILVFGTSLDTLGWILVALGSFITLMVVLVFGAAVRVVKKGW